MNDLAHGTTEQREFLQRFLIEGSHFQLSVGKRGAAGKLQLSDSWYNGVPQITGVQADLNVFFAPAQRKRHGSLKADVHGTLALWVDVDDADRAHEPVCTLPPSALVWSGHGWHLYYFFRTPLTAIKQIEAYNKILINDVEGADGSCWNANRLMRVPGTWNPGDAGKDEQPTEAVIVRMRPVVYDWGDVDALAMTDLRTRALIVKGTREGFKSRSERDYSCIAGLVAAGATNALIERIYTWSHIGDKMREHPDPSHYLTTTITKVRADIDAQLRAEGVELDGPVNRSMTDADRRMLAANLAATDEERGAIKPTGAQAQTQANVAQQARAAKGDGDSQAPKKVKKQGRIQGAQILAKDNGYWVVSHTTRQVSTFVLHPKMLLDGKQFNTEDALVCDITIETGERWEDVTLPRSAFNSVSALDKHLGNMLWVWLGNDSDVRLLITHLTKEMRDENGVLPRIEASSTIGLHHVHDEYVFLGDTQTLTRTTLYEGSSGQITWMPTRREHPHMELGGGAWSDEDRARVAAHLPYMNDACPMWIMIGWYGATCLKPWLETHGYRYPILNVTGSKGSGKCVVAGTLIDMADGTRVPIEQLQDGGIVRSWDENLQTFVNAECSPVEAQGVKPCVHIDTWTGRGITASYDHPFLTIDGWKQAHELRVGDYIIASRERDDLSDDLLDLPHARFIGYMLGDGSMTAGNCTFTKPEGMVLDRFRAVVRACGWESKFYSYSGASTTLGVRNDEASEGPRDFLLRMDLYDHRAREKRVPRAIMRTNREIRREVLAAYYECDGYRSKTERRQIEFSSASRLLLRDVQELLARDGITSTLRRAHIVYKGNHYWKLTINGDDAAWFLTIMPVVGEKAVMPATWKNLRVTGIHGGGIPMSLVMQATGGKYAWTKSLGFALSPQCREVSRDKLGNVIDLLRDYEPQIAARLQALLRDDVSYERVSEVRDVGDVETYNIEVYDTHTFVAEGLVTHNTTMTQRVLMPLFGQPEGRAYNAGTTPFVILSLLGSANATPIAFSEFRVESVEKFNRTILMAYDTGHDPRGRGDQTTVDYPLSAPFSVDGEDVINDAAARERIVVARLRPDTVAEGSSAYAHFHAFRDSVPRSFAGHFIQKCLQAISTDEAATMLADARRAMFDAFPSKLPDRVRNNYTVVLFGARLVAAALGCDPPDPRIFESSIAELVSLTTGRSRTLVDDFVESVVNAMRGMQANIFGHKYDERANVLYVQLSTAHAWWLQQRRRQGRGTMERDSINAQLREAIYFTETKVIEGMIMYGIDLGAAQDAGLDIPNRLQQTMRITVPNVINS
jgi:hypothetical protein